MVDRLTIGTRGSALALAQTNYVMKLLREYHNDIDIRIKIIKTTGDIRFDKPLNEIGGKGVFLKEIEEALLEDQIDLAVHSMKDVPIELQQGLSIAAIPKREDPRDAFVCKEPKGWFNLAAGSVIGTSSLRRTAQLMAMRPHWVVKPLRGNLDTRWKKFEHGEYDAIIVAMAGLKRLGLLSEFIYPIDVEEFIPAIGQGAIGVEVKEERYDVKELVSVINDVEAYRSVYAERQFLKRLGGDCHSSVGAYAKVSNNKINMIGFVASADGSKLIKDSLAYNDSSLFDKIGLDLAEKLIQSGAYSLLGKV
jgi:hydroxymethylbilane synthase